MKTWLISCSLVRDDVDLRGDECRWSEWMCFSEETGETGTPSIFWIFKSPRIFFFFKSHSICRCVHDFQDAKFFCVTLYFGQLFSMALGDVFIIAREGGLAKL